MRRGFSILLILFFGFGPLSVLIDGEDANLPACCRRQGAHHCVMAMHMAEMMKEAATGKFPLAGTPTTCPQYPGLAALFPAPAPAIVACAATTPSPREQARIGRAASASSDFTPAHAHAGRGPPAKNLG